jgi:protoporphyrin/coproporphyrin ferrochelatase
VPIGFATENHETLLDVHHIIHQLEGKHDQVKFVQMDCVNDHPEFLAMAARWANPQIEALLEEPAVKAHSDHDHSHGDAHSHHHHGAVHHH